MKGGGGAYQWRINWANKLHVNLTVGCGIPETAASGGQAMDEHCTVCSYDLCVRHVSFPFNADAFAGEY